MEKFKREFSEFLDENINELNSAVPKMTLAEKSHELTRRYNEKISEITALVETKSEIEIKIILSPIIAAKKIKLF